MNDLGQRDWDGRFVGLARHLATWSKDPSTQTGCVIVRPDDRTVAAMGYNGLPRGVKDHLKRLVIREVKYEMIVHAELNAILSAHEPLRGCTLYCWPFPPCSRCAACIIQAGITRVVSPPVTDELRKRWGESLDYAELMFEESGVILDTIEHERVI